MGFLKHEKESSVSGLFRSFQTLMFDFKELEGHCLSLGPDRVRETQTEIEAIKKNARDIVGRFVKRSVDELKISISDREKEIEYAAVAFIDDRLIRLEWGMSGDWSEAPLEIDLYGTRNAGSEIFSRIEGLDPSDRLDGFISAIYYFLICLGFLGKFDPLEDGEILRRYQKNLLSMTPKNQQSAREDALRFVQDLPVVGTGIERKFLPTANIFNLFSVVSIAILLIAAQLLWFYYSIELIEIAHSITSLEY